MTREIDSLSKKKKELAEKYQLKTDRDDNLVKELIAVENECEKVHKKLKDAVGNISNENTQVRKLLIDSDILLIFFFFIKMKYFKITKKIQLKYQTIELAEMLKKLNESISLEFTENDKSDLSKAALNDILNGSDDEK